MSSLTSHEKELQLMDNHKILLNDLNNNLSALIKLSPKNFDELEAKFLKLEEEIQELTSQLSACHLTINKLTEENLQLREDCYLSIGLEELINSQENTVNKFIHEFKSLKRAKKE